MTTVLVGVAAGLAMLVVLLLALLATRRRSSEAQERRSRTLLELSSSIDLEEVLSRTLEAAGA